MPHNMYPSVLSHNATFFSYCNSITITFVINTIIPVTLRLILLLPRSRKVMLREWLWMADFPLVIKSIPNEGGTEGCGMAGVLFHSKNERADGLKAVELSSAIHSQGDEVVLFFLLWKTCSTLWRWWWRRRRRRSSRYYLATGWDGFVPLPLMGSPWKRVRWSRSFSAFS